jgi:hypothetical protein
MKMKETKPKKINKQGRVRKVMLEQANDQRQAEQSKNK